MGSSPDAEDGDRVYASPMTTDPTIKPTATDAQEPDPDVDMIRDLDVDEGADAVQGGSCATTHQVSIVTK